MPKQREIDRRTAYVSVPRYPMTPTGVHPRDVSQAARATRLAAILDALEEIDEPQG